MPPRLAVPILLLSLAAVFLIANKAAYKGYFQDDDLDTLSWTPHMPVTEYFTGLLSPKLSPYNVRPVGHAFYRVMEAAAGMHFGWWVAAIQVLHLLNAFLVWQLLRSLDFDLLPAAAGAVFFAFHPATFSAYWQPQSIFDLLCGTFSAASVLLYRYRRWIPSFVCFWLAYKAKEVAIMLPAALLLYEWWLGERRYLRLLPFFAVSLLFGLQAVLSARYVEPDYRLTLGLSALSATIPFYLGQLFLNVLAGLALLLAPPLLIRDRRIWFGVAAATVLFVPLLFLPGRLMPVYCYVPLIFAAIEIAAIAGYSKRTRIAVPAVILLLWLPLTFIAMRHYRSGLLAFAAQNRTFVNTLDKYVQAHPESKSFLIDNRPAGMQHWGLTGAIHYLNRAADVHTGFLGSLEGNELAQVPALTVVSWDGGPRRLDILQRDPRHPFVSYMDVARGAAIWQLGRGWLGRDGGFRLIEPLATATLEKPVDAQRFEVRANVDPRASKRHDTGRLTVVIDGVEIGAHVFAEPGWQTVAWSITSGPPAMAKVEFRTDAPFCLGISAFGFKPQ